MTTLLYIHVLMTVLAAWRMVDLFGQDRITAWVRTKYPTYLWSCHRCLSVWAGIAATCVFVGLPWLNWPLAISWLYMWRVETLMARPQRNQIVVEVSDAGIVSVPRSNLDPALAFNALTALVAASRIPSSGGA